MVVALFSAVVLSAVLALFSAADLLCLTSSPFIKEQPLRTTEADSRLVNSNLVFIFFSPNL